MLETHASFFFMFSQVLLFFFQGRGEGRRRPVLGETSWQISGQMATASRPRLHQQSEGAVKQRFGPISRSVISNQQGYEI